MMKQVSRNASIFFRFLVIAVLLAYGYPSSPRAAIVQSSDNIPCADGAIVLVAQANAPASLSIQKATCGDFSTNVELRLENISAKQIKAYEVSHTQDYENIRGVKSSQISDGVEINPGESVTVRSNGGFLTGYSY